VLTFNLTHLVFSRPYFVRSRLCDRLAFVVCRVSVCNVMYCG